MTRHVTSDHHFYHENIIDYCNRPFSGVEDMHSVLKQRWESVISEDDVIVYGGDIALAQQNKIREIVDSLLGQFVYIKGNHDDDLTADTAPFPVVESLTFQHSGYRFFYTHSPKNIPSDWTEWILHGHTHNDDPFIHYDKKTINVCVENTQYAPIPLPAVTKALSAMNNGDIADTISDSPIRHHQWWQDLSFLTI